MMMLLDQVKCNMRHCADDVVRLTYSPAYSPPETLKEVEQGVMHVSARTAADMWAVGVIAYELAVKHRAFTPMLWPRSAVMEAAMGLRPYPWESEVGTFANIPELRALGRIVRACLARSPDRRPSAEEFLAAMNHMYDEHAS
jgi:serine/threonine protein kinase